MKIQLNACNKPIKDEYRYGNTHIHKKDYQEWLNQTTNFPHPITPVHMLQSMDFTGEELFYNCKNILKRHNVIGPDKKMLEIGGRDTSSFINEENFWELEYHNLNLENRYNCPRTIIGNITNCKEIPDNSFDFIYSMDTFEHIDRPWKASEEITRILKPNGIVFIVTLFAWRYHPDPIDYWRFSPHCLKFLFETLQCIECNWDIKNRRVPFQGQDVDNDICPEDHFGPWLENWRVYYIGRKK